MRFYSTKFKKILICKKISCLEKIFVLKPKNENVLKYKEMELTHCLVHFFLGVTICVEDSKDLKIDFRIIE